MRRYGFCIFLFLLFRRKRAKADTDEQGDSLAKECEPYEKAMQDMQEALEKNKQRPLEKAMSWAAMTSSMLAASSSSAAAAASSSPRLASSSVHAVPTGH